ncbi:MAG: phosphotransferase [Clostridiales bacterium]|nr:phosphotransferase [Clostridiales bacterium]
MKELEFKTVNGTVTVIPAGRIDSANAGRIAGEIDGELEKSGLPLGEIDCSRLMYISSAGLRMILKLRKRFPALVISEASSEVYDVFEMTGFTEMMTAKKACRRIDVSGCSVIGEGANGTVYRLDPETIVKVYKNADALDDIKRERELARKAFVLGIPTAIPYDIVRAGGSWGSVFELLSAESFASILAKQPERVTELAKMSVSVLKKLHSVKLEPGEIPTIKSKIFKRVGLLKKALPEELADKLVRMIEAVPDTYRMIHGDFHVKNIMLMDGEPLLIDMDTLSTGHPVFEFGNIYCAYCAFNEAEPTLNDAFFGIPHELGVRFMNETIEDYFRGLTAGELVNVRERIMIAGYTRALTHSLAHPSEGDFHAKTVRICTERLAELLGRQDRLDF